MTFELSKAFNFFQEPQQAIRIIYNQSNNDYSLIKVSSDDTSMGGLFSTHSRLVGHSK